MAKRGVKKGSTRGRYNKEGGSYGSYKRLVAEQNSKLGLNDSPNKLIPISRYEHARIREDILRLNTELRQSGDNSKVIYNINKRILKEEHFEAKAKRTITTNVTNSWNKTFKREQVISTPETMTVKELKLYKERLKELPSGLFNKMFPSAKVTQLDKATGEWKLVDIEQKNLNMHNIKRFLSVNNAMEITAEYLKGAYNSGIESLSSEEKQILATKYGISIKSLENLSKQTLGQIFFGSE